MIIIKEEQKDGFHCIYWALKCYGTICLDFKDLATAEKAFKSLKYVCEENGMYKQKMATYK